MAAAGNCAFVGRCEGGGPGSRDTVASWWVSGASADGDSRCASGVEGGNWMMVVRVSMSTSWRVGPSGCCGPLSQPSRRHYAPHFAHRLCHDDTTTTTCTGRSPQHRTVYRYILIDSLQPPEPYAAPNLGRLLCCYWHYQHHGKNAYRVVTAKEQPEAQSRAIHRLFYVRCTTGVFQYESSHQAATHQGSRRPLLAMPLHPGLVACHRLAVHDPVHERISYQLMGDRCCLRP